MDRNINENDGGGLGILLGVLLVGLILIGLFAFAGTHRVQEQEVSLRIEKPQMQTPSPEDGRQQ